MVLAVEFGRRLRRYESTNRCKDTNVRECTPIVIIVSTTCSSELLSSLAYTP
jgi:hypothetical protein